MRSMSQEVFGASMLVLGMLGSGVGLHEVMSATPVAAAEVGAEAAVSEPQGEVPLLIIADSLLALGMGAALLQNPRYNPPTVSANPKQVVQG